MCILGAERFTIFPLSKKNKKITRSRAFIVYGAEQDCKLTRLQDHCTVSYYTYTLTQFCCLLPFLSHTSFSLPSLSSSCLFSLSHLHIFTSHCRMFLRNSSFSFTYTVLKPLSVLALSGTNFSTRIIFLLNTLNI